MERQIKINTRSVFKAMPNKQTNKHKLNLYLMGRRKLFITQASKHKILSSAIVEDILLMNLLVS